MALDDFRVEYHNHTRALYEQFNGKNIEGADVNIHDGAVNAVAQAALTSGKEQETALKRCSDFIARCEDMSLTGMSIKDVRLTTQLIDAAEQLKASLEVSIARPVPEAGAGDAAKGLEQKGQEVA